MVSSVQNPNSLCGHGLTQFVEVQGDRQTTIPYGACRAPIGGKRFSCRTCGFNLHPFCKSCPASLLSPTLHPQHTLTLISAPPGGRQCDVCARPVQGAHYSCRGCDFDVHPVCSQLAPRVPHALDPRHSLQLQHQPRGLKYCDVCRDECGGWAYRCGECSVDVHIWCAAAGAPVRLQTAATTSHPVIQSGQLQSDQQLTDFMGSFAMDVSSNVIAGMIADNFSHNDGNDEDDDDGNDDDNDDDDVDDDDDDDE